MGSRKHYGYAPCPACGRKISSNGGAYTSHYKKHIREGVMERLPLGGYRVIEAGYIVCTCKKKVIPGVGEVFIVGNCPIHISGGGVGL